MLSEINNFQKHLSNMLAVKNGCFCYHLYHLKYLSISKLINASILSTGVYTVHKVLTNIVKNCREGLKSHVKPVFHFIPIVAKRDCVHIISFA